MLTKLTNSLKLKIMKKISYLLMLTLSLVIFNSCEEDESGTSVNFASFDAFETTTLVDPNGSNTQDVEVYFSKTSGSDRTIGISIDPNSNTPAGSYDVPNSVTIPSGSNKGVFTVTFSDVDLGIGVSSLILNLDSSDDFFTGDSKTLNYMQKCNESMATLDITFDAYGSECGWYIEDALGGVVASGGGYADGQTTASESIMLCEGRDYTFVFTDSYGDGMLGSYTLTFGGAVKVTGAGTDFGDSESTAFDTK